MGYTGLNCCGIMLRDLWNWIACCISESDIWPKEGADQIECEVGEM